MLLTRDVKLTEIEDKTSHLENIQSHCVDDCEARSWFPDAEMNL